MGSVDMAVCCPQPCCAVACCSLICSNGADALKKYEGDKDMVEAAMEAGEILQQLHTEGVGANK